VSSSVIEAINAGERGAQAARFMTGVAFALFANDMTGRNLAPGRPPFSWRICTIGLKTLIL